MPNMIHSWTNDSNLFMNWNKWFIWKIWLKTTVHSTTNDSGFFSTWLQTTIYSQSHDSNQFSVLEHTTHGEDPAPNNESFVYKWFNRFYGLFIEKFSVQAIIHLWTDSWTHEQTVHWKDLTISSWTNKSDWFC